MKIFVLLFFAGFLYAQEPNSGSSPSTNPEETPKAPDTSQQETPKEEPRPPDASQEPAPKAEKTAVKAQNTKAVSPSKPVAVPPQPKIPPSEEPIPYYNPLHPQSSSAYQEGDLPSEGFAAMTSAKTRRHRFSAGGKLFDYHIQGERKEINLNVSADYGYTRKYFEFGPYAELEINDFDVGRGRQIQDALLLEAGAFFEVNFTANTLQTKNMPSIGFKAGYKRVEDVNYLVGQTYITMKFFLNPQTAFFVSLAPYLQYKPRGQKWEWGVSAPAGLRFYFY